MGYFSHSFLLFFPSLLFTLFTGRVLFSTQECKLTGDWLSRIPGDVLAVRQYTYCSEHTNRQLSVRQTEIRHTQLNKHTLEMQFTLMHEVSVFNVLNEINFSTRNSSNCFAAP